jgi:hypothetical protein
MAVSLISTGVQFPDNTIQTTAAGGGSSPWVYISTTTASNASSFGVTSGIDSTYNTYLVVVDYIYGAATDVDLLFRIYYASSLITANYYYTSFGMRNNTGSGFFDTGTNLSRVQLNGNGPLYMQGTRNESIRGTMMFYNPATPGTTTPKAFSWSLMAPKYLSSANDGTTGWVQGWATNIGANNLALNGFIFYAGSNNIYGQFHLYGLKTS